MTTDDEIQSVLLENYDQIVECGITKPSSQFTLMDKESVVQPMCLHSVIVKSTAELYQFRDGLDTLNVASAMKCHCELLSDFFINKPLPLNAGQYFLIHDVYFKFYSNDLLKNNVYRLCS